MGCDIHIVLERRRKGDTKWIGQFTTDNWAVGHRSKIRRRDYGFFGRLAHVRDRPEGPPCFYPRNLPRDVSDLAWDHYIQSPTDHHSASHLSPQDFCAAWLAENQHQTDVRPEHVEFDLLGIDSDDDAEYRLVFWFDN